MQEVLNSTLLKKIVPLAKELKKNKILETITALEKIIKTWLKYDKSKTIFDINLTLYQLIIDYL